ncbi:MAG: HNH endonuclease [Pirellulales bacterium]|nr:HNH endonuclease [Pirellulales bacterium]
MEAALRQFVRQRARDRCEYCQIPQAATPAIALHIEHIVARQHRGPTSSSNLCLSCDRCNAFKGTNLASIDPETGEQVNLFRPREDRWDEHFEIRGGVIVGTTPVGRATVALLNMNDFRRVELRETWLREQST